VLARNEHIEIQRVGANQRVRPQQVSMNTTKHIAQEVHPAVAPRERLPAINQNKEQTV
jgi:hypothetical protein